MNKLQMTVALAATFASTLSMAAGAKMSAIEVAAAKVEIQELMYRYAWTHNTDDAAGYAALFTEDADLMGVKGRDAILKMGQGEVTKMAVRGVSVEGDYRFGFMRSEIFNPIVDVIDATHAKGACYLQVVVPNVDDNNKPVILSVGIYQDEYRKVNGKWLIAKRKAGFAKQYEYPGLGAKLGLGGAAPPPAAAGAAK